MLATCAECGTRFAPDLAACPHCGSEEREEDEVPKITGAGVSFPEGHAPEGHVIRAADGAEPDAGALAEPEMVPGVPEAPVTPPEPPAAPPTPPRTPPRRPPAPPAP